MSGGRGEGEEAVERLERRGWGNEGFVVWCAGMFDLLSPRVLD